jgi:hypothetical protein
MGYKLSRGYGSTHRPFCLHPDNHTCGEEKKSVRPTTLIIGNELDTLTSKGLSVPTEIGLDVGFKG